MNLFFLKDFVYGGIDGIITTFAVVSGVSGAALPASIVLILGFANLFADGLSMAIGNYLSVKSEQERYLRERQKEEHSVKTKPKEETREIRSIFRKKGFKGPLLEKIVKTITKRRKVWIDTMMKEELELFIEKEHPLKSALITFASFVGMGFMPLITFLIGIFIPAIGDSAFLISLILSLASLFLVGVIKGYLLKRKWYFSGIQTLGIGGLAAVTAYLIGFLIKGLVGL